MSRPLAAVNLPRALLSGLVSRIDVFLESPDVLGCEP
jgi:hypothetical protein